VKRDPEAVEVARAHISVGFSLAEKRCWENCALGNKPRIILSSLGMVEIVAGILYNVGVVAEMNEYEQALLTQAVPPHSAGNSRGRTHPVRANNSEDRAISFSV
jgi:hypothetical protein